VPAAAKSFSGKSVARSYRELLVWQKAKALAVQIYPATEQFPKNETYRLTSQVRTAAVSVASNIAEGPRQINSRRIPALPRPSAALYWNSTLNWPSRWTLLT
jgi:predicted lipoprotein